MKAEQNIEMNTREEIKVYLCKWRDGKNNKYDEYFFAAVIIRREGLFFIFLDNKCSKKYFRQISILKRNI